MAVRPLLHGSRRDHALALVVGHFAIQLYDSVRENTAQQTELRRTLLEGPDGAGCVAAWLESLMYFRTFSYASTTRTPPSSVAMDATVALISTLLLDAQAEAGAQPGAQMSTVLFEKDFKLCHVTKHLWSILLTPPLPKSKLSLRH